MSSFSMGRLDVSDAAKETLTHLGLSPQFFFNRHQQGDWGAVDDQVAADNERVAAEERSLVPITPRYNIEPGIELMVVTATDRTHTLLQLASEFEIREANGCSTVDVLVIATDGQPYGDISASAIAETGRPPFCLIVTALKN